MQIDQISHSNDLLNHIHIHHKHLSVKIFPNLGGSVQELIVHGTQIIDGISIDEWGLEDYKSTYKSSVLFPFPNRIENGAYQYKGVNYQLPINEPSVNNAIHGLVYNKPFEIIGTELYEQRAKIILCYVADGTLPGFPFPFEFRLVYRISFQGGLSLTFEVKNTGTQSFPYGMGWHPYFFTDKLHDAVLSFASRDFYSCNKRSIPIKTKEAQLPEKFNLEDRVFDDAFSLDYPRCDFNTRTYNLSLEFKYPEGTYLQLYTPDHRQNIAIEPMTCVANSFNNKIGFSELSPGKSDTLRIDLFYITKT
jgi:aldose 1-epimerase